MDRILRILPAGLTVALLVVAIAGSRWVIGRPRRAEPAPVIFAAIDCATRSVNLAAPHFLPADESARGLRPAGPAPQVVLAGGFPNQQPATEADVVPGPELNGPGRLLESPRPADASSTDLPAEMPIAESAPAAMATGQSKAAEVPREIAARSSPLAAAATAAGRSEQLEQAASQADRRTRHGLELAGRGAHFAARSEFIGALRLVAEALDAERETGAHGRALAAALCAMKEAEDFLPGGSRLEADLDLPGIIASHVTPVLQNDAEKVTSMTAMRCYLTFAQEQFAAAAGHEVAGSMALHSLGKLHAALARKKTAPIVAPECKAVALFQAALLVYPKNYLAANDLGVLLAQCGSAADARKMFEHSVAICPQSDGWHNLAAVYRQLGQKALAERAAGQAMRLRQVELSRRQPTPSAGGTVCWVEPRTFAQTSPLAPSWPAPTPAAAGRMSWGAPAYQR